MLRTAFTLASGAVAGYLATRVKGPAEGVIQARAERVWPLSPEQRLIPGADQANHGELMPPTVVVTRVLTALGRPVPADRAGIERFAAPLHFGMGAGAGAAYALLRRRVPAARVGFGAPAGLALYALTHGSLLPVLRVQPFPWRTPKASVTWEVGSHAVYGVVLETYLSLADGLERWVTRG